MRVDYPRAAHDGVRRFLPSWRQLLALAGVGFLALVALRRRRLRDDADPAAERAWSPRRRRSSTTTTARPRSAASATRTGSSSRSTRCPTTCSTPCSPPRTGLLREPRHLADRHRARVLEQPARRRDPGRLDDHPAVREERLPHPGAHVHAQVQGVLHRGQARHRRDDKDKILEDYLNTIYFGRGAYGIQAAAQAYFGKSTSGARRSRRARCSRRSSARPAATTPTNHADRLAGRFNYVLDGMVAKGWLTAGDRAGMQVPPLARSRQARRVGTNYFLLDTVRSELQGARLHRPGHRPRRAAGHHDLRPRSQRAAVRAVRQERPRQNAARACTSGCPPCSPGTGAVVAMYGGETAGRPQRGHPGTRCSRARVQAVRAGRPRCRTASGSRAASHGNSPLDIPGTDKQVNNEFDRDYGTSVDLVKATEQSINTAYVDLTWTWARGRSSTRPSTPASRRTPRAWSPTPSTRSAPRRSATSTWPRPTRPSRPRARRPRGTPCRR